MSSTLGDMEELDAVAELIEDARLKAKMNRTQLARAVGVDVQTMRRYRRGERRTPDTTRKIELVFGWPKGYLNTVAEEPSVELPTSPRAQQRYPDDPVRQEFWDRFTDDFPDDDRAEMVEALYRKHYGDDSADGLGA